MPAPTPDTADRFGAKDCRYATATFGRNSPVPRSILDAVRDGHWDFEPSFASQTNFSPTKALPGSNEKLQILCDRVRRGLPLWHPEDRRFYAAEKSTAGSH